MATASQSLFNMTVGADNTPSSQGLLMPKLQYRFRALFLNFGVGGSTQELTKQVIDIARPSVSFTEIPIDIYNSKMYLAGKHEWTTTTVNLRDDAAGNVSKLVGQQIQKQMDFVEQASAAAGQDYKFQLNYEVLDGGNGTLTPTVLETWELYGCFIQTVNYNNMNYGTNEAVTIGLTVRYDNAIQSPLSSGIGTNVGRAFGGTAATGIGPGRSG
jgi:hypothetical protein|tara:strand:- start:3448 stop:4089 length:642 start_codon:yes stop_codon:yes gene_type:complete